MITEQAMLINFLEYLDLLSESHVDGDLHKQSLVEIRDCLLFLILWPSGKVGISILTRDGTLCDLTFSSVYHSCNASQVHCL